MLLTDENVFRVNPDQNKLKDNFLDKENISGLLQTKKDKTISLFLEEKLLNDFYETYDNAVTEANLIQMLDGI